jgi:hypothetical protein
MYLLSCRKQPAFGGMVPFIYEIDSYWSLIQPRQATTEKRIMPIIKTGI